METPFAAYAGDEPYVFVCYAHDDSDVVFPELQWLKDQGFNIWYDEGVSPGSEWRDELADSISKASLFLCFVSPQSINSQHCKREINFALENSLPLSVVYLEETELPSGLSLSLGSIQAIMRPELSDLDYRIKLLKSTSSQIERGIGNATPVSTPSGKNRITLTVGLAGMLGLVIGITGLYFFSLLLEQPSSSTPIVRVPIQLDGWDDWKRGNPAPSMAISADGKTIVFVARDTEGSSSLMVRQLDHLDTVELVGTEGAEKPFFSPDGHWVGYFNGRAMKRVSLDGGDPITITTLKLDSWGASWGADDRITFAEGRAGLKSVSVSQGDVQTVTQLDGSRSEGSHRLPHHIVGHPILLLTVHREKPLRDEVWSLNLTTKERRYLFDGNSPAYVASGHIVYAKRNSLWAVPFDVQAANVSGSAQIIQGATEGGDGNAFAVARSGPMVYMPDQGDTLGALLLLEAGGASTVLDQRSYFEHPRFSNDGESLAVGIDDEGEMAIWIYDIQTRASQRFATPGSFPLWSPDDQSITFMKHGVGLVRQRLDGAAPPETLIRHDSMIFPLVWTADGKTLFYAQIQSENEGALFTADLGAEPRQLEWEGPGGYPSITNDEQWVAICDWPDDGIYVGRFPDIGATFDGPATGCTPRWGEGNKRLYYQDFDKLWAVEVNIAKVITFGKREMIADLGTPNPFSHFDVDKRGRTVFARHEDLAPKPAVLMMNWANMLE